MDKEGLLHAKRFEAMEHETNWIYNVMKQEILMLREHGKEWSINDYSDHLGIGHIRISKPNETIDGEWEIQEYADEVFPLECNEVPQNDFDKGV